VEVEKTLVAFLKQMMHNRKKIDRARNQLVSHPIGGYFTCLLSTLDGF